MIAGAGFQGDLMLAAESDEEMVDAQAAAVPRAEDIDMTGAQIIDQAFLDALPPELRGQMMSAQARDERNDQSSSQPASTAQALPTGEAAEAPVQAVPAAAEATPAGAVLWQSYV